METPIISVIIPVYNGEQYLRLAIDSVLRQTFQSFELIVVDDGSTDGTSELVSGYGTRVKYVRQENRGAAAAFNHGIRLAQGQFVSWLSHDDIFMEAKLELQFNALQQQSMPAVCYTDVLIIDCDGNVIAAQEVPEYALGHAVRHILSAGAISTASYSLFFDRRCIDQVGMYDESKRYTQDADMFVRLARVFPLIRVPQKLIRVREHASRGIRAFAKPWGREAAQFYRYWLDKLTFEELFPELSKDVSRTERAEAILSIANSLASQPPPVCWVAISHYRKAMFERPRLIPFLTRKVARLYWRHIRSGVK